jgi:HK97 gp10 family phage protein
MAGNVTFKAEGFKEFAELLKEMQNDFGEKDSKKILGKAVRNSMNTVLSSAKMLVPVDTGALRASLRLEVRKPTRKDKRSKYVKDSDVIIGTVTTAPASVLAKKKFMNAKTGKKQVGIESDARAIANEFGTAKMSAHPFMRPALETNAQSVVGTLKDNLKESLSKYRSKKGK